MHNRSLGMRPIVAWRVTNLCKTKNTTHLTIMNWEVIIHGTPEGQKIAASADGKSDQHILSYYTDSEGIYMKAEHAGSGGRQYCYYHYLHYGLLQNSGRSGGYLGITLRSEKCSEKLSEIYSLLQIAYMKVAENLLEKKGAQIVFKQREIEAKVHQEIEDFFSPYIKTLFGNSKQNPIVSNSKPYDLNPSDAALSVDVAAAFAKGATFRISAAFPTQNIRKQLKSIEEEREQLQENIRQAQEKILNASQKNQKILQKQLKERDNTISDLNTKLRNKQKEQEKLIAQKEDLVTAINESAGRLLSMTSNISVRQEEKTNKESLGRKMITFERISLIVVILLLLLSIGVSLAGRVMETSVFQSESEQYTQSYQEPKTDVDQEKGNTDTSYPKTTTPKSDSTQTENTVNNSEQEGEKGNS